MGEGAFCKVYKALYKPTNEIMAVKVNKSFHLFILFIDNQEKEGQSIRL